MVDEEMKQVHSCYIDISDETEYMYETIKIWPKIDNFDEQYASFLGTCTYYIR